MAYLGNENLKISKKRLKIGVDEEFCSSYDVNPTCDVQYPKRIGRLIFVKNRQFSFFMSARLEKVLFSEICLI